MFLELSSGTFLGDLPNNPLSCNLLRTVRADTLSFICERISFDVMNGSFFDSWTIRWSVVFYVALGLPLFSIDVFGFRAFKIIFADRLINFAISRIDFPSCRRFFITFSSGLEQCILRLILKIFNFFFLKKIKVFKNSKILNKSTYN